jgi:Ni,Fe-hydrogenase I large subunit
MTPEQYEKMIKEFEFGADFHAPDSVIVEGLTLGYAEYQKEMVKRRMDELQRLIVHTIDTLQTRNTEHTTVIAELLRQNQSLKDKLKEQAK